MKRPDLTILGYAGLNLALVGLCFAAFPGQLGFPGIWLPLGIQTIAFIRVSRRQWPGLVVGFALTGIVPILFSVPHAIPDGLATVVAAVAAAIANDLLIVSRRFRGSLGRITAYCLASALVGGPAFASLSVLSDSVLTPNALQDWNLLNRSASVGGLLVGALALAKWPTTASKVNLLRLVEGVAVVLATFGAGWLMFSSDPTRHAVSPLRLYMVFPFLIWAAVRFRTAVMAFASVVLSATATIWTDIGRGPFVSRASGDPNFWFETFLLFATGTSMMLAAFLEDQSQGNEELRLNKFAIDHASVAVLWIRRDATISYVNDAAVALLGLARDQLVGADVQTFDPSWDRARWDDLWSSLQGKESHTFEREIVLQSGNSVAVEVTTNFVRYNDEELQVAYVRDVTAQKQALQAVRESQQSYQLLVQQASDGIFVADQSGRYLDANERGCQMVGYSLDEIRQLSMSDLVHDGDLSRNPFRFDELHAKGFLVAERTLRKKDGSLLHVEISASLLPDGRFLGLVRDIGARHLAEQTLRRSLEQISGILASLPCGVLQTDLESRVLYANELGLTMLGEGGVEPLGKRLQDLGVTMVTLEGERYAPGTRIFKDVVTRLTTQPPTLLGVEYPNGTFRWVVVTAVPYRQPDTNELGGAIIALLDVTAQRDQERALRESEERLRLSVDAMPALFWTTDLDLRIVSALGANVPDDGSPEESLEGKNLREIFHADSDDAEPVAAHLEAIDGREQSFDYPWQGKYYSFRIRPLTDPSGVVTGAVTLALDITERKEAEFEVVQLNQNLERLVAERTAELADTVHELESFSYSVSHDLRAPLRALTSYAHILRSDYDEIFQGEPGEFLERMEVNAKRMSDLIDTLLMFSRMGRQPVVRQKQDMGLLARTVYDEFHDNANPKPDLEIQPRLPDARVDPKLMHQVLHNLFSNAIKFSRRTEKPRIEFGFHVGTDPTVYFVRDNGTGFDMAYVDKIFGVFTRLHSTEDYEGTGVGLAIVQRIINRHGGKIWAESAVGKGTTIFFTVEPEAD